MRKFLKKRWHSLPVGIISALLVVGLLTGGAFAAYGFLHATVDVTVDEAIVVSVGEGDDIAPYMEPDGVLPEITLTDNSSGSITVTIQKDDDVDASEFCPGETLVVPVNLRNRSDGALTIDVVHSYAGGLDVSFKLVRPGYNSDWVDSITSYTMAGHEGEFGSSVNGATVLYVKVHAPGDCTPGIKTFQVTFSRS